MSMNVISTSQGVPILSEIPKEKWKDGNSNDIVKAETLEDLRNPAGKCYRISDTEKLMEKYDPETYEKYSAFAREENGTRGRGGMEILSNWLIRVKKGLVGENINAAAPEANDISGKNEEKLSVKAQDFLKKLRAKYGDYDIMIGNSTDDLKALAKSGSKEFSVILSSADIERMANDEKYADEKMRGIEGAVKMSIRICEENGYTRLGGLGLGRNGILNRLSIAVNDDGSMKLFAEIQKISDKQKEWLEKAKEKKAEEKKNSKMTDKKNPYGTDDKNAVKRITVEASSAEELFKKIGKIDWDKVKGEETLRGRRIDFSI